MTYLSPSAAPSFNPFSRIYLTYRRVGNDPSNYTGNPKKLKVQRAHMCPDGQVSAGQVSAGHGRFLDSGGGLWNCPDIFAVHTFDGSFCTYVEASSDDEALAKVILHEFTYVPFGARRKLEEAGIDTSAYTLSPFVLSMLADARDRRDWCLKTFACPLYALNVQITDNKSSPYDTSADVIIHLPVVGIFFRNENDAIHFKLMWG